MKAKSRTKSKAQAKGTSLDKKEALNPELSTAAVGAVGEPVRAPIWKGTMTLFRKKTSVPKGSHRHKEIVGEEIPSWSKPNTAQWFNAWSKIT